MPAAHVPIGTSELVGVSLPATVTVFLNGTAQRSVSATLVAPPLAALAVTVGDPSVARESQVTGFRPVITFTREVVASDRTRTIEVVGV